MTAQETNVAIGAESTLSSSLASGATTINVDSTAAFPSVPFYVVIDPDVDAKREVILVDSSVSATTFVLSDFSMRGLDGTTDTSHLLGAKVACVPIPALWADINDRVDGVASDVTALDSSLAVVAKTGAYADVTGAPTLLDEDDMASDSSTDMPSQQSVKAYVDSITSQVSGVVADGKVARVEMTATSATATIPADPSGVTFDTFEASDVGKTIHVQGAGTAGAALTTTIQSVGGSRTATLADAAATTTVARWDASDPSGAAVWGTDNTTALNTALSGGGTVQLPEGQIFCAGRLNVTEDGTILRGHGTRQQNMSIDWTRSDTGTTLLAGMGTDEAAIYVSKEAYDPASFVELGVGGIEVRDLNLYGGDGDRPGIRLTHVASGVSLTNLFIANFVRCGVETQRLYDAVWRNVWVSRCGTDATYAGVKLSGDAAMGGSEQTNALHVFGMRIEDCPWLIDIDAGREIDFVASKFHRMTTWNGVTHPAFTGELVTISGGNTRQINFVSCQFRGYEYSDPAWATSADAPYTVSVTDAEAVAFVDSYWASSSTKGVNKPVTVTGDGRATFSTCSFRNTYGDNYPFRFNGAGVDFLDCTVYNEATSGGVRELFHLTGDNRIRCRIVLPSGSVDPAASSGYIFTVAGTGNSIEHTIEGNVSDLVAFSTGAVRRSTRWIPVVADVGTLPVNQAIPKVFPTSTNPNGAQVFQVANTVATTITQFEGYEGMDLVLIQPNDATDGNTTIKHGSGIYTSSFADVVLTADTVMRLVQHASGNWYQV